MPEGSKWTTRVVVLFSIICVFCMISVVVRTVTRDVVIRHFGIENSLTDLIVQDTAQQTHKTAYDWAELYPFLDGAEDTPEEQPTFPLQRLGAVADAFSQKVYGVEDSIKYRFEDLMVGHDAALFGVRSAEDVIGWNMAPIDGYNSIVEAEDGYFVTLCPLEDVSSNVRQTIELSEFCAARGTDFLYIQAPSKVDDETDPMVSGVIDFSQANADALLTGLSQADVPFLDLRERIRQEGLPLHELFFRTDHHWLPETGLWAAGEIVAFLNGTYGYAIPTEYYDAAQYTEQVYEDWFLGSQGKKASLAKAEPDDFSLLYPKYDTSIRFEAPTYDMDVEGSFDVLYNMDRVNEKDYMSLDPYSAYQYSDQALLRITNHLASNDLKVLWIKDSFSNVVTPFISQGIAQLDVIDLRYFTGSVQTYIEETEPDLVVAMYAPGSITPIDASAHTSHFDFR